MLLQDAETVLKRHLVAGKRHEAGAALDMERVKWSSFKARRDGWPGHGAGLGMRAAAHQWPVNGLEEIERKAWKRIIRGTLHDTAGRPICRCPTITTTAC